MTSAPPPNATPTPYVREPGYAEHYRDRRFRIGTGARTHRREHRAIGALLRGVPRDGREWLDAPSGAGRFSGLLPGPAVRCDLDAGMLRAAGAERPRVCASVHELPFEDDRFGGALCFRLLHHLPGSAERIAVLRELARVTAGPILVSFFHAGSLQHLRRAVRRRLGRPKSGRVAISLRRMLLDLDAAGLRLVAARPLLPLVSEQWVLRAERGVAAAGAATARPRPGVAPSS